MPGRIYSGAIIAQNVCSIDLSAVAVNRVELVTKDAVFTASLSRTTNLRAARWSFRVKKKIRAHVLSNATAHPQWNSRKNLSGESFCSGQIEHDDEVCQVVVEVCPDDADWEGSWQNRSRFPSEHRDEEEHQTAPLSCCIGETSISSLSASRLADPTEQPTDEEGYPMASSSAEHHSWSYSKIPQRDALTDLQADVALAIPSWYYRITGMAPEATYGHDLQEAAHTLAGDESLLAEPPPQAGRSIILIPPYQRVALATELLIASFTGGMTAAEDDNDQLQAPARKWDFDAAALVSKVSLRARDDKEMAHVDWGRGDLDPPGFFLAPEEEAMLQQLSANATSIWDVESSPGAGTVSNGSSASLYSWPVLLSTITCGCVAGLMAMRSEAPVLAVDIFLITWSACVTAVAAYVVGVLKRGGSSSSGGAAMVVPSHHHHHQQTAYEGPAKRRLWSRVVLVMGTIAAMLAASTCLALVVRAMVSALMLVTAGVTSMLPKLAAAVGLFGTVASTSASTSAAGGASLGNVAPFLVGTIQALLPLLNSTFFAVSIPALLLAAGLLWMSSKHRDNLPSKSPEGARS